MLLFGFVRRYSSNHLIAFAVTVLAVFGMSLDFSPGPISLVPLRGGSPRSAGAPARKRPRCS